MKPPDARQRLPMAIGAVVPLVVVVAGTFLVEQFAPFDRRFESCEQNEARWKLVVNYSVDGSSDSEEHVDYFRPRRPFDDETWRSPFESDSTLQSEWLPFPGMFRSTMSMSIACGFGPNGGTSRSESYQVSTKDTADGVEVEIEFRRREDDHAPVTQQIRFTAPFRRKVTVQQGSLAYSATWQRVR